MTVRIVVDASVAVKWFVPEARSAEADALSESGHALIAPSLIQIEVTNVFVKKIKAGLVRPEDALSYIALLPRYLDERIEEDLLLPDALRMAATIAHPIYDCIYLLAAQRNNATLVTDDSEFLKRLARHGIGGARSLADWRSIS